MTLRSTKTATTAFLEGCRGKKVAIIGDVLADLYVYGRVEALSSEAPALVLGASSTDQSPGGAANVALNVSELGGVADLIGVLGGDESGRQLKLDLERSPGVNSLLVLDAERPTTTKTHFVSLPHGAQLLRVDRASRGPLAPARLKEMMFAMGISLDRVAATIVADCGNGVVDRQVFGAASAACARRSIPMVVAPNPDGNILDYRGASAFCLSLGALARASGRVIRQDDAAIEEAAAEVAKLTGVPTILVKRREEGLQLIENGQTTARLAATASKVVEAVGAGETVLAVFTLGLATGLPAKEAASLANTAAGLAVEHRGTCRVDFEAFLAATSAA